MKLFLCLFFAMIALPAIAQPVLDSISGIQFTGAMSLATASGTNTYAANLTYTPAAYVKGEVVVINFTNANTGAATLNLNSLGAKAIQLSGAAIVAGQIPAGASVFLVYDGTQFQIIGQGNNQASSPSGSLGAIQYYASGGVFGGAVISGLVKANGTSAPTAAVSGTDYQLPYFFQATPVTNEPAYKISEIIGNTTDFGVGIAGNARGGGAIDLSPIRTVSASNVASGAGSFAAGVDVQASGFNSVAIGSSSSASGQNAISIGVGNLVNNVKGLGLGTEANSCGNASVAVSNNLVLGSNSMGLGPDGNSAGDDDIAFGISDFGYVTSDNAVGFFNAYAGSSPQQEVSATTSGVVVANDCTGQFLNGDTITISTYTNNAYPGFPLEVAPFRTTLTAVPTVSGGNTNLTCVLTSAQVTAINLANTNGDTVYVYDNSGRMYAIAAGMQNAGNPIQGVQTQAFITTTNATQTTLTLIGGAESLQNSIRVPANATTLYHVSIIGRVGVTSGTSTTTGAWEYDVLVSNVSNAGTTTTTVLGTPTLIGSWGSNSGAVPSGWAVAFAANNTYQSLDIKVTGAASTTIGWGAIVTDAEVWR